MFGKHVHNVHKWINSNHILFNVCVDCRHGENSFTFNSCDSRWKHFKRENEQKHTNSSKSNPILQNKTNQRKKNKTIQQIKSNKSDTHVRNLSKSNKSIQRDFARQAGKIRASRDKTKGKQGTLHVETWSGIS